MANVLPKEKQISVLAALAEGNSIRSIERMTGIHRDTIMRLGVKIGQGCAKLLDEKMRGLDCNRLELDEVWGYIGKKMRHVKEGDDPTFGDVWTFCAIDAETKLVPSYHVSNTRDLANTTAFISDLASRLNNRVMISTDAMNSYEDAIETVFGVSCRGFSHKSLRAHAHLTMDRARTTKPRCSTSRPTPVARWASASATKVATS